MGLVYWPDLCGSSTLFELDLEGRSGNKLACELWLLLYTRGIYWCSKTIVVQLISGVGY
jgi:hypothetical protein